MARSRRRWKPSSTIAQEDSSRFPTRKRATSSIGRWVAERPMRQRCRGPSAAAGESVPSDTASWKGREAWVAFAGAEPSGRAPFAARAAAPATSAAPSPAEVPGSACVPFPFPFPFPLPVPVGDDPVSPERSASSRSRDSARCAPRLLPATAWISSTMTVCVRANAFRPDSLVSRMWSDSGVVTRMCGGCRAIAWRAAAGVSPVRTIARIATGGSPSRSAHSAIPRRGASRLRSMS